MPSGALPLKPDHRDFSFPRTFGAVSPLKFPKEYNCDAGFGFPNQVKEGYPNGCTGYTQSEICQDEDKKKYDPAFTYKKTLFMMDYPDGYPCDIRTSLKSTLVYGLSDGDELTAVTNRRGKYFNVIDSPELDAFDDIRNALWLNHDKGRSVSIGTPWMAEWNFVGKSGKIPSKFRFTGRESWHNWKICGWKEIDGEPYLMGKTWQGNVGDKGWLYFPREVINNVMEISGTGAFTVAKATSADVETIKLPLLEHLISLYYRLKSLL